MKSALIALTFVTFVLSTSTASAGVIGPDCDTCHNTTWELTYVVVDPVDYIYDFTLTAIAGSTVDYDYIDSVAIKVASNDGDYEGDQELRSAPGGIGAWVNPVMLGILNAGGCNPGSAAAFACTSSVGAEPNGATAGGTHSWVFRINLDNTPGLLLNGIDAAAIKARFTDDAGRKVGALLSEDITITEVPEPASLLLLGTGAAAVFARRRRSGTSGTATV